MPLSHLLCYCIADDKVRAEFGNIIGGSVMVGAVYWFVYLRNRKA